MMKTISLLFIISLFSPVIFAKTITGVVLNIHDGDTLTILLAGETKKAKLRLMGVDTPEIDFNGSSQGEIAFLARDYLMGLLPINATIQIELSDKNTDINGRYLGQIKYNGLDLNLEILKAGWGATYFIYPYDKKVVIDYQKASKMASEQGLGIFSDKYKTQPLGYMFRQQTKGIPGSNLVADFVTKKIYSSEDVDSIPHFQRVFFSSEETALTHGFSW